MTPFQERRVEDQQARREALRAHRRWKEAKIAFWVQAFLIAVAIGWAWQNGQRAANDIQHQRRAAILAGCLDQNARHDRTVAKLHALIDRTTGLERQRAERNITGTLSLIDALAPKQNCRLIVRQAVQQH